MSSKIFIIAALLFIFTNISSAARCDAQGKCKYGGRCGKNNQCICPVNCVQSSWTIDYDSLYCLPSRGGGFSKIFFNICHVMAHACETQKDVPLIKFEYQKPKHQQCLAKRAREWRLCSRPEDFMGQCGGTSSQYGSASDGGVCMQHRDDPRRIRCECSKNRYGENCELKILKKVSPANETEGKTSTEYLGVSIGASLGAGVLLGMLICTIIRAIRKRKPSSDPENQNNKTNIYNEKFDGTQESGNTNSNNNNNHAHIVKNHDKKIAQTPSTSCCPSKRQRLNGLSVTSSRSSGDSNNNLSSKTDEVQIVVSTSSKNNVEATKVIIPSCEEFAQRLSGQSCGIKEAYTI